jgi:antitoxin ParD1/3/4
MSAGEQGIENRRELSTYPDRVRFPLSSSGVNPMATVRKTITVTDQQDAWITDQVKAGRFANDSELVRDLIRREQERLAQVESLRQALIEGERSGEARDFDFAAFRKKMIKRHRG